MKYILVLIFFLFAQSCYSQDNTMELPTEIRDWYHNHTLYNTGGSCVFMSIGMNGVHSNNNNAASCPWTTTYGPENVGGATPTRVANMAKERNLKIYNVTADSYDVMHKWFEWSAKTNRFCALGAGTRHFQTLYGKEGDTWKVCNNNSPQRIDSYTESGLQKLHASSGYWAVFLIGPSTAPVPKYVEWWKK